MSEMKKGLTAVIVDQWYVMTLGDDFFPLEGYRYPTTSPPYMERFIEVNVRAGVAHFEKFVNVLKGVDPTQARRKAKRSSHKKNDTGIWCLQCSNTARYPKRNPIFCNQRCAARYGIDQAEDAKRFCPKHGWWDCHCDPSGCPDCWDEDHAMKA
jgi:hypothetical protein